LYASSAESLLSVVRVLDDELGSAMVFGHNPKMSELASGLSGSNLEMATCAVAEFQYQTKSWGDVGAIAPARVTLDTPKTQG
jgi:phosphohistidine phosphatase